MAKRIGSCLMAALLLLGAFPCWAAGVGTSATAAVLMDAQSGRVLYEHNADREMLIASTTKIMTALVALREGTLSEMVKVSRNAACTEGSSMYLKDGEELTLETLLYGLMLCSGNDAAVAIAEHISGSEKAFAQLMNRMAGELGMTHSSFANPNGLDAEGHYSTARDMAILARAAMNNETLARIVSTRTITIGGRTMTNHNKLLSYMDGCIGLKTGYTKAAGRTLVSCAERGGQRLIAVTLQDGNDWVDHQALYEYGFATYPARRMAVLGEEVRREPVQNAVLPQVSLVAADHFFWPAAENERIDSRVELDKPLTAPLSAGTKVGQMVFTLQGTEIGRVDLLCGESVAPRVESALNLLKLPD